MKNVSTQLYAQNMHATYTCAYVKHHTQDYKSVISSLPETDQPSFFGLPANIERSSQRTISSRVISQLKVVTRMGDVEGKFDRETWATELSPILTLWKRLNQVSPVVRFSLFSIVLPSSPLHMPHTSTCHTPAEYYYSAPSIDTHYHHYTRPAIITLPHLRFYHHHCTSYKPPTIITAYPTHVLSNMQCTHI